MEKTWTIVKFIEENTVEAVPSNWLVGDRCYWPPYSREKLIYSIRNYDEPNTCWPSYNISIFCNGIFNSYLEARNKTKVAEYTSDLNDEDAKSRKYRKKKNHTISSEESEVEYTGKLPSPPLKPKAKTGLKPSFQTQNQTPLELPDDSKDKASCYCSCCPAHRGQEIDEHMKKITKQYYFMSNILKDISSRLESINISQNSDNLHDNMDSLFVKFSIFPINTSENLAVIEEHLQETNNFKAACKDLSKMGGNSMYEFIKRCMSQLLTNSFANEYSLFGRKNKKKFMGLKLADLVMGAAEIFGGENTTKKEIEDCIMRWLRRANERKN